ncbi:MAG: hypothetical protein ACI8UX_000429 [Psychromonas sp.]
MGVYYIQGAKYVTGVKPYSVMAQFSPVIYKDVFKEVEESIHWQMEFPCGATATRSASSAYPFDRLLDRGIFELSLAVSYGPFQGRTREKEFKPFEFPITHH